jgi:hypothetical protein
MIPNTFFQVNPMQYVVCPKSNASDFFCAAQNSQERKVGVKAGGGGTHVYSWTFLS